MDKNTSPNDRLEENVERLLSAVGPTLHMPQSDADRVLSEILEEAKTPHRRSQWFLGAAAVAAAVAAAALVAVILLSGGPHRGVAWADVVRHFENIEAVSCPYVEEIVSPNGDRRTRTGQVYFQDPGKMRFELWEHNRKGAPDQSAGQPDVIVVDYPNPEELTRTRLVIQPLIASARRETVVEKGNPGRRLPSDDLASLMWQIIQGVRSLAAEEVGRRRIGDVTVVGFEAGYEDTFDERFFGFPMDSVVRIWASEEDGRPLGIQFDGGTYRDGVHRRVRFEPLSWNPVIDPTLFSIDGFGDTEFREERAELFWFNKTRFRSDVSFALPAIDGGSPVLELDDVVAVPWGQANWELDNPVESMLRAVMVEVRVEQCEWTRAPQKSNGEDQPMLFLDGQPVAAYLDEPHNGRAELLLFIDSLNLTLEEFEERYLVE